MRSTAVRGTSPPALWLQAGDAFADLRIPQDPSVPAEAFAGITTYEAPALTWHHTLDRNNGFTRCDRGVVECDGDELIERGGFERGGFKTTGSRDGFEHDGFERDGPHSYEETWQRIDTGAVGAVLTATHAMVVRVGRHCLAMRDRRRAGGEFDVRHTEVTGIDWNEVTVLGDGAELPRLPVVSPGEWVAGSEIVLDGVHWRVAERWG